MPANAILVNGEWLNPDRALEVLDKAPIETIAAVYLDLPFTGDRVQVGNLLKDRIDQQAYGATR